MTDIVTMISTLGFPIVMCLFMGKFIMSQNEQHKQETEKMMEVLNENTLAVKLMNQRLLDMQNEEKDHGMDSTD